jgi:hypothetical protein
VYHFRNLSQDIKLKNKFFKLCIILKNALLVSLFKNAMTPGTSGSLPVILATQEAEIRRISV